MIDKILCDLCNGKKTIVCPGCSGIKKSMGVQYGTSCAACHGKGIIYCPKCNSDKFYKEKNES